MNETQESEGPYAAGGTNDVPEAAGTAAQADGGEADGATAHAVPEERVMVDPSTIRRSPRYLAFAFAGAAIGAVLALVLAVLPIGSSATSTGTLIGLLMLGFVPAGVLVGLITAVVLDRRSVRGVDRDR